MHITCDPPVAIGDIIEAKQWLARWIYKTGMPHSDYFNEHCKSETFLKSEDIWRTGSFKIRGAFDRLGSLADTEERKGVVACSAGSHAQGTSLPCAILGIDSKAVMPKGALRSKVAAACNYSAEVVLHGDNFNGTVVKVGETIGMEDRTFTPPYDGPRVATGQGTIGLETMRDLYDIDNVIAPTDGGGLTVGIVVTTKSINPTIRVIGIQPENVHGMAAPFHSGEITTHRTTGVLVGSCDAFRPGNLTYEVIHELVDDIVLVDENGIRNSMITLIRRNKIVTESADALVRAALLNGRLD